jgi:hypothetical protein
MNDEIINPGAEERVKQEDLEALAYVVASEELDNVEYEDVTQEPGDQPGLPEVPGADAISEAGMELPGEAENIAQGLPEQEVEVDLLAAEQTGEGEPSLLAEETVGEEPATTQEFTEVAAAEAQVVEGAGLEPGEPPIKVKKVSGGNACSLVSGKPGKKPARPLVRRRVAVNFRQIILEEAVQVNKPMPAAWMNGYNPRTGCCSGRSTAARRCECGDCPAVPAITLDELRSLVREEISQTQATFR